MDQNILLSALLVMLLAASVFQAFELNGLKSDLAKTNPGSYNPASIAAQPVAAQVPAQAGQGGGLNGLPNQVGGC
ncbi:hypothetical protein HY994_00575 [Candidatus Micrarchaeota archaeon]|nr:hypothetical protein [Candidatus Micrarchaeota archaeon]